MPFMPLDVVRLLDSDLFALSTGEEFKAAVALWCKSWSQNPAGSLPNDDRVLAHLSSANARWKKIKEGAMRGWVMCSDNRWYHPVVAEKALEALPMRQQYEDKKAANAARKERERQDRKDLFAMLRNNGVVPEYDTPTKQLRELAKLFLSQENKEPVTTKSQPVTRDMSQHVTAKTETETETVKGKKEALKPADPGGSGDAVAKSAAEMTKAELWSAGKSLLLAAGMPEKQCGSFVGKLCKDYGDPIVIDAVRAAALAQPADPAEYLKAVCMRSKGERATGKPMDLKAAQEAANAEAKRRLGIDDGRTINA
jgi:hypothetical protein